MEDYEELYKKALEEIRHLAYLNQNLLRIQKERANAERKLRPVKGHTGYVLIQSQEKDMRFSRKEKDKNITVYLNGWETIIQTPYSTDFPFDNVKGQVNDEFTDQEWMMGEIGIDSKYIIDPERDCEKSEGEHIFDRIKESDDNILIGLKFRRNFKAGFWEIILTHTGPIGEVPDKML